ncbi:MAG: hypothetical protein EB119_10500, partial [Synechococcaceae bacterium WBB_34_004]|nr:hypothetical protein [Synechococcaceae bacterium WBB_34_004]
NGVGVSFAEVIEGQLIVSLTDGSTVNAGNVQGDKGDKGDPGDPATIPTLGGDISGTLDNVALIGSAVQQKLITYLIGQSVTSGILVYDSSAAAGNEIHTLQSEGNDDVSGSPYNGNVEGSGVRVVGLRSVPILDQDAAVEAGQILQVVEVAGDFYYLRRALSFGIISGQITVSQLPAAFNRIVFNSTTAASAGNNTLFLNAATGKLTYKDNSGTLITWY